MPKAVLLVSVIVALLFVGGVPALAASASPTAKQREELQKRQMELKEKKASLAADTKELRISRIKAHFERMSKRAKAANERYTKFLARVKSRRDKLVASGKNGTKIDTFLAQANGNQVKVVAAIAKLDADIATLDGSTNPKAAVVTLKADMTQVKRALQELHVTMKTVVQELKRIGGTDSGRATGSATTP